MAAKELAVEAWIWANMLILFREIDPPELFREYGLKQSEFDTLTQLFLSDRPLTQTELKKRLLTTKGSVSLMLSKMEKQGLLRREGNKKDRRCRRIDMPRFDDKDAVGIMALRLLRMDLGDRGRPLPDQAGAEAPEHRDIGLLV